MKKIRRNAAAVAIVCSLAIASSMPVSAGVIAGDNNRFTSTSLSLELEDSSPATGFAFAVSPRLAQFLLRIGLIR